MMKKKLLFVTYFDEHPDDGLSYVIELAKVMHEDLTIFLLRKKSLSRKIDELMTAAAFAEAGEHETARQVIAEDDANAGANPEKKLAGLFGKCRDSGINVDVYSSKKDVVTAIDRYFKQRNGIDIVLLGPNVADNDNLTGKKLKRLLNIVSRPVVTIARQATAVPV